MIQRLYLILKEIFSNKFISFIVLFAIIASVLAVTVFNLIGMNFNNYINKRFVSEIAPNTIKVTPNNYKDMFLIQVRDTKAPQLTEWSLSKIRNMPGVRATYPSMSLKVPNQVRIFLNKMGLTYKLIGEKLGIMGGYTIDAVGQGVTYWMIKDDIRLAQFRELWNNPNYDLPIPVLLPESIIKAFNDGMAEPNGVSRISPSALIGKSFTLRLNYSSLKRNDTNYIDKELIIVGITNKIDALTLIMPLKAVLHYNKQFEKDTNSYLNTFVNVNSHNSMLSVSQSISRMGFKVETGKSISAKILNLKKNVNLIIDTLMYVIIILSMIAISFSTIIATLNRIEYYRIMRIVGGSKAFITLTIVIKYALLGLAGAYCGLLCIKYLSASIPKFVNIGDIKLTLHMTKDHSYKILLYGSIIPVISTIPALIRLYGKGLNRD